MTARLPPVQHEKHRSYRWNGEPPSEAAIKAMKEAVIEDTFDSVLVWKDPSGWAFTRYFLEIEYETVSYTAARRKLIGELLDSLPPWPFSPTPTGWTKDGFPKEFL